LVVRQREPETLMGANSEWRQVLATRWRATASGPFFGVSDPPAELLQALPQDYLAAVAEFGGREGFLGQTYLRLYRLQELVALNLAYELPALVPEVIVFGSNGGGEAFAFSIGEPAVVQVPFLPLASEYIERRAADFTEFLRSLAASGASSPHEARAIGMEVHAKHPVCLGGSPTDPANQVLVPAAKHAEVCRFWNKVYRNALAQQQGSA
jgi:hypothetical protein